MTLRLSFQWAGKVLAISVTRTNSPTPTNRRRRSTTLRATPCVAVAHALEIHSLLAALGR
jgi:hypothetical protein